MNHSRNHNEIIVAGRRFATLEDLEEACFHEPELEEIYDEMMYLKSVREDIDTYQMLAEMDYGDGSVDLKDYGGCNDYA